jgi:hypothetical protein
VGALAITPGRLAIRLTIYFACLIGGLALLMSYTEWGPAILPLGGYDLDLPGSVGEIVESMQNSREATGVAWSETRLEAALVLSASLIGTVLLMIPISWIYIATQTGEGYSKNFIDVLIILPICATSIVLLIQDSLALAFGLAALVAAVRFRVRLRDALDGVFIFAAICVGLASGVGFLGVGVVMTVFFCYAAIILWALNYGAGPLSGVERSGKPDN